MRLELNDHIRHHATESSYTPPDATPRKPSTRPPFPGLAVSLHDDKQELRLHFAPAIAARLHAILAQTLDTPNAPAADTDRETALATALAETEEALAEAEFESEMHSFDATHAWNIADYERDMKEKALDALREARAETERQRARAEQAEKERDAERALCLRLVRKGN